MLEMVRTVSKGAGLILAALALGAGTAAAAEAPGPRCPGGEAPAFTGHPFKPLYCSQSDPSPAPAGAEPAPSSLPRTRDRARRSLRDLEGRWLGLTHYGLARHEVFLEVSRGRGRLYRIRLQTKDYVTHSGVRLQATAKDSFWAKGRFSLRTTWEALSGTSLEGRAWLGRTSEESEGERQGFDRELVVIHEGRGDRHRVRFILDTPPRIRYAYTYTDGTGKAVRILGELKPTDRSGI